MLFSLFTSNIVSPLVHGQSPITISFAVNSVKNIPCWHDNRNRQVWNSKNTILVDKNINIFIGSGSSTKLLNAGLGFTRLRNIFCPRNESVQTKIKLYLTALNFFPGESIF